jgi:phage recombination protein Bet
VKKGKTPKAPKETREMKEAKKKTEIAGALVAIPQANLMPEAPKVDSKTVEDFIFGSKLGLTPEQKALAIRIAIEFNLNPFKREVHFVKFGDKFNIITGYEVYLKRAERSRNWAGFKPWVEGNGQDMRAYVEVWRKDWTHSLIHSVPMTEYYRETNSWKKMPETMLKKVAIAQAFRMAFPDELGGMPYTSDELPPDMNGEAKQIEPPPPTKVKSGTTERPVEKREKEMDKEIITIGGEGGVDEKIKTPLSKDEFVALIQRKLGFGQMVYVFKKMQQDFKKDTYDTLTDEEKIKITDWIKKHSELKEGE